MPDDVLDLLVRDDPADEQQVGPAVVEGLRHRAIGHHVEVLEARDHRQDVGAREAELDQLLPVELGVAERERAARGVGAELAATEVAQLHQQRMDAGEVHRRRDVVVDEDHPPRQRVGDARGARSDREVVDEDGLGRRLVDQVAIVAGQVLEPRVGGLDEDVRAVAGGAQHLLDAEHLVADGVAVAERRQHLMDGWCGRAGASRRQPGLDVTRSSAAAAVDGPAGSVPGGRPGDPASPSVRRRSWPVLPARRRPALPLPPACCAPAGRGGRPAGDPDGWPWGRRPRPCGPLRTACRPATGDGRGAGPAALPAWLRDGASADDRRLVVGHRPLGDAVDDLLGRRQRPPPARQPAGQRVHRGRRGVGPRQLPEHVLVLALDDRPRVVALVETAAVLAEGLMQGPVRRQREQRLGELREVVVVEPGAAADGLPAQHVAAAVGQHRPAQAPRLERDHRQALEPRRHDQRLRGGDGVELVAVGDEAEMPDARVIAESAGSRCRRGSARAAGRGAAGSCRSSRTARRSPCSRRCARRRSRTAPRRRTCGGSVRARFRAAGRSRCRRRRQAPRCCRRRPG